MFWGLAKDPHGFQKLNMDVRVIFVLFVITSARLGVKSTRGQICHRDNNINRTECSASTTLVEDREQLS